MPDELARALEREAPRQGVPESALVREGMQQYLASLSTSKLALWMGKGRSKRTVRHDTDHEELVDVLEKKHPARRRRSGSRKSR